MTLLYTMGLLIGTFYRTYHGSPLTLKWFLVAVSGMVVVYLIERFLVMPYLRKQAKEQAKKDYVIIENVGPPSSN